MAPKASAAKKAPSSSATSAAVRRQEAQQRQAAKEAAELDALAQWIDAHDPLLDHAAAEPIPMEALFSSKLVHRTFTRAGAAEEPYDWSEFRKVLDSRSADSPRWFLQLREEDLLAGEDGMEGVTVDCYVIAEATRPTLSPGEYVVKVHWPYSDAEDNAPERILPLEGQGMCWRRVVKADGSDMNTFLLQRRSDATGASGTAGSAAATTLSSSDFGFGAPAAGAAASAAVTPAAPTSVAPSGFSFGFSSTPAAPAAPATTTPGFGFGFGTGAAPPAPVSASATTGQPSSAPFSFGFGQPTPAAAAPTAGAISFGASPAAPSNATATTTDTAAAAAAPESGEIAVQPLKTSEVLFVLWSRKRLTELAKEIRSGSRIVREGFALDATKTMKLVMQNDRKDDVAATAHRLLLTRLFAKQDDDVKAIDAWVDDCPVYDEAMAAALQAFRERQLSELASESDLFQSLRAKYHDKIASELARIVAVRELAADKELDRINGILAQMKERKLAEKSSFRLLKFYAKNDVQRFRPFGKISGISEMGESVDVCVPAAHVNINPFTGKPI